VVFVSPYDQKTDPHWRVTFTVGPTRYESSRRFGSVAEAETYATDSWHDCEERSIGPDDYQLTSAAHDFHSQLARPQLFWKHRDAGERVAPTN
jgi:hypothetical protein